jgi:hypothetical protein
VADRFGLSYPDMQVRFGLMSRQEVWRYVESDPVRVATVEAPPQTRRTVPKLSESTPRRDAPPL